MRIRNGGKYISVAVQHTCHSKIEKLHYFESVLMEQEAGWVRTALSSDRDVPHTYSDTVRLGALSRSTLVN